MPDTILYTKNTIGRQAAIGHVVNNHLDDGTSREGIAEHIRQLAPLGRSERWQHAITYWAHLVLDETTRLDWALLQGSVTATQAS